MKKLILVILSLILFSPFVMAEEMQKPAEVQATPIQFTLINNKGDNVTEAVFGNKPTMMFFGFTHCPDLCPTVTADMSGWLEALGADADKLNTFFVTMDPDRDTPQQLTQFLSPFNKHIVGLTGKPEQLQAFIKIYENHGKSIVLKTGDKGAMHSAKIFLLDKTGNYSDFIKYQEKNDVAIGRLKRLILENTTVTK